MAQAIFTRWKCGKCHHWNLIEQRHCSKCGGEQSTYAAVYRDEQKLTTAEEEYYTGTAPRVVRLLDQINATLVRIEELLNEKKHSGNGG